MKVLHVLSSDRLSGAENVVLEIMDAFRGEIDMVYASPNGPIARRVAQRGHVFFDIGKLSVRHIRKAIKAIAPDIIHAHDIRASVFVSAAAGSIPVISHLHCNFINMRRITLKSLMYRLTIKKYAKIIAVSDSVFNDFAFAGAIKSKVAVIYNVVNHSRLIEAIAQDAHNYAVDFLFLGRLSAQKDPLRAVEIAARVIEKVPGASFGIAGEGKLKEAVTNAVNTAGLGESVTFFGFMDNPYKLLSQAKVLLMSSVYEGLPMGVLEAMLLGTPVVSTPVDGVKAIIDNGINGCLSSDNEDLVKSVCKLLTDTDYLRKMSYEAEVSAERINNIGEYKKKILNVYQSV